MYLTENQKQIIDNILNQKISDVYSYLNMLEGCEYESFSKEFLIGIYPNKYEEVIDEGTYVLQDKFAKGICDNFFEFIALCQTLERYGMIYALKMPDDYKFFYPLLPIESKNEDNYIFQDEFNWRDEVKRVNQILFERYLWEFFPYPELKGFVERGYKTVSESIADNEDKDRKKAQKTTFRIALVTIILSVLISASTAVFNYITYNKEREVIIKNTTDFNDTTKVFLINPKIEEDTSKSK